MALPPALASMRSWRPSGWMKLILGIARPSGCLNGNGKVFQSAQRVVIAALHRAGDLDGLDLARQRRQERLAFEARDQLTDAHMNARAEPDMPARPTGDVVI